MDNKGNLPETAHDLPRRKKDDEKIRFAAGLMNAVFWCGRFRDSRKRVAELSKRLKKIATKGDKIREQEFYRKITENKVVIGIIDEFLQAVVNEALPIWPYLFNFAKDLATRTDKRNVVKFGIAILRLCQNKSVLNDIKIFNHPVLYKKFCTKQKNSAPNLL